MSTEVKCPFHHAAGEGTSNRDWWPNQVEPQYPAPALIPVQSHGQGF